MASQVGWAGIVKVLSARRSARASVTQNSMWMERGGGMSLRSNMFVWRLNSSCWRASGQRWDEEAQRGASESSRRRAQFLSLLVPSPALLSFYPFLLLLPPLCMKSDRSKLERGCLMSGRSMRDHRGRGVRTSGVSEVHFSLKASSPAWGHASCNTTLSFRSLRPFKGSSISSDWLWAPCCEQTHYDLWPLTYVSDVRLLLYQCWLIEIFIFIFY